MKGLICSILFLLSIANISTKDLFDCLSQQPLDNGNLKYPNSAPARIFLTTSYFTEEQNVTVSIVSNYPLKAYILQARSPLNDEQNNWKSSGPHGWWPYDNSATRCIGPADTILFNSENDTRRIVQAVWLMKNPSQPKVIYFRASLIAADGNVWQHISSSQLNYVKELPSTVAVTKPKTTLVFSTTRPPTNDSRSKVYQVKESVLEETIVEFEQRNRQLLLEDDLGNEGEWSRSREKERMDLKERLKEERLLFEHKKIDEKHQQEEVMRMEISDRESHSGSQKPNLPPPKENSEINDGTTAKSLQPFIYLLLVGLLYQL